MSNIWALFSKHAVPLSAAFSICSGAAFLGSWLERKNQEISNLKSNLALEKQELESKLALEKLELESKRAIEKKDFEVKLADLKVIMKTIELIF